MPSPKSVIGKANGITMTGLVKPGWVGEGTSSEQSYIFVSKKEGCSMQLLQENNNVIIIIMV